MLAAEGKAILYISHVLEVVEQVCNRVIVVAKGRILADAPPSDLTKLMSTITRQIAFELPMMLVLAVAWFFRPAQTR